MKELDPQPRRAPARPDEGQRLRRRGHSAHSTAGSPSLLGLRIVVAECNRRGPVARTLTSLRWLSLAGAEVLYGDLGSDDGTASMVRTRFPFVRVVECVDPVGRPDTTLLRQLAGQAESAVRGDDELAAPVRFVLFLSAGLEVSRHSVSLLLRELAGSPLGSRISMGLAGGGGRGVPSSVGSAWVTRRRDLTGAPGLSADVLLGRAIAVAPRCSRRG